MERDQMLSINMYKTATGWYMVGASATHTFDGSGKTPERAFEGLMRAVSSVSSAPLGDDGRCWRCGSGQHRDPKVCEAELRIDPALTAITGSFAATQADIDALDRHYAWTPPLLEVTSSDAPVTWRGIAVEDGPDNPAPARVCRKNLPGHPVTLNADESKCWKCDGTEFA